MTNRKSYTRFRLVPKSTTLDDLEWPYMHSISKHVRLSELTTKISMYFGGRLPVRVMHINAMKGPRPMSVGWSDLLMRQTCLVIGPARQLITAAVNIRMRNWDWDAAS